MRKLLALGIALVFTLTASAQYPTTSHKAPAGKPSGLTINADDTAAEKEFKRTGPKLFTMDAALKERERTGREVVCWMGPHIFADANARATSQELADTTIQAVMDTDGETIDRDGKPLPPLRVKFSNGGYGPDSKVAYIPVSKLNKDSGKKILAFVRGGSDK